MQKELERLAAARGFPDVAAYVQSLVDKDVQQIRRGPDDLRQEFARLADEWKRGRGATLRWQRKWQEHPAYRNIVAMGEAAVPLILAELEREPDHWFFALHEIITGASPVPEESRGKLHEMAKAWIDWGRK